MSPGVGSWHFVVRIGGDAMLGAGEFEEVGADDLAVLDGLADKRRGSGAVAWRERVVERGEAGPVRRSAPFCRDRHLAPVFGFAL
jgi:hypothetical protein